MYQRDCIKQITQDNVHKPDMCRYADLEMKDSLIPQLRLEIKALQGDKVSLEAVIGEQKTEIGKLRAVLFAHRECPLMKQQLKDPSKTTLLDFLSEAEEPSTFIAGANINSRDHNQPVLEDSHLDQTSNPVGAAEDAQKHLDTPQKCSTKTKGENEEEISKKRKHTQGKIGGIISSRTLEEIGMATMRTRDNSVAKSNTESKCTAKRRKSRPPANALSNEANAIRPCFVQLTRLDISVPTNQRNSENVNSSPLANVVKGIEIKPCFVHLTRLGISVPSKSRNLENVNSSYIS